MVTAKEPIAETLKRQPDGSSNDDDLIREIAFDLMVLRGLKDSEEGRVVSNDELNRRIKSWLK